MMAPRNSMRTKALFSKEGKFWSKIWAKMAKSLRLVLEAYGELSL